MALQGHPRSILFLASVESAYATSYQSSTVTLVLSCPVSEITAFLLKTAPIPMGPIPPECRGVLLDRCSPPRSEDPKLIIRNRVPNYFRTNSTYTHTVPQRHGRTDGRTDERLTTAILRFAIRASRGKNTYSKSRLSNKSTFVGVSCSRALLQQLTFI